jgi:hypothetical protein
MASKFNEQQPRQVASLPATPFTQQAPQDFRGILCKKTFNPGTPTERTKACIGCLREGHLVYYVLRWENGSTYDTKKLKDCSSLKTASNTIHTFRGRLLGTTLIVSDPPKPTAKA